ncbi:MAG: hypothetical protein ISS25_03755 [Nanoarchaeota archaeon]|nr:hypothetical protein [DPANN group archaeon]MBL7116918.1 hypothetical protein [Nanoarchaeota archaeon]
MRIHVKSLSWSTAITMLAVAIVTVWSELSKPFKSFLAGITGHHWVTKSVFSVILFVLLYFIFMKMLKETDDVKKETYYVIGSAVLGGLVIFIFYVWHFFS